MEANLNIVRIRLHVLIKTHKEKKQYFIHKSLEISNHGVATYTYNTLTHETPGRQLMPQQLTRNKN